ncbi:MAG: type II secretion system protein [Methylophilaceae bacterium]|nr:type II secretion system protein [Methylophilaceae bacterium]
MPSGSVLAHCTVANSRGFSYIGLLIMIAIAGVGLSAAGMSWQYQVRAEKERQLLFVGGQFRNAINSYFDNTPSGAKIYPLTLEDLLLDKRLPKIKRHLRRIYSDPISGKPDWGLAKQQGRIVGVYSLSKSKPLKQAGFDAAEDSFTGAASYRAWVFGLAGEAATVAR